MNINSKILSIPPYISTSWKNIASLHIENRMPILVLIVTLHSGVRIEVPNLQTSIIEEIFAAHSHFIEVEEKATQIKTSPKTPFNFLEGSEQLLSLEIPLKNGFAEMEGFGTLLQHNPHQANTPNLPPDVLEKITQISKTMGLDDPSALPKPEPDCNCIRCQIAKAMQAGFNNEQASKEEPEEIVSDEELKFRTWDISQTSDKLYVVTNPLDIEEHYNVFLGDPIGCSCGESRCEHIKAVLNT